MRGYGSLLHHHQRVATFQIHLFVGLFAEGVSEHRLHCWPQETHLGVLAHQAQATELGVVSLEEVKEHDHLATSRSKLFSIFIHINDTISCLYRQWHIWPIKFICRQNVLKERSIRQIAIIGI